MLRKAGVEVGDLIRVKKGDQTYEGPLMPRSGPGGDEYFVLKLQSGYNVGIRLEKGVRIERLRGGPKPGFVRPQPPKRRAELPRVSIISTGGTIASRVDYTTGAVHAAITAEDLYSVVPELSEIADIEAEVLMNIFSEDVTPKDWSQIAKSTAKHIKGGADGVVITHGTDCLHFTAAALSFALRESPVPVVLVGAQRSSDRPSSDAALNLIGAVSVAANAPFSEVVVAMHENATDGTIAIHRGTKVRKLHTSKRGAFRSIGTLPLAYYRDGKIDMAIGDYEKRTPGRRLKLNAKFDAKVALIKFSPGMDLGVLDWYIDQGYRGIVLEGTGLGHVSHRCFPSLEKAIGGGIVVCMTSQCIHGRTNLNVYETGRRLIDMGVVPLEDMLAETAYVKLSWSLGQSKDPNKVKELMLSDIAHEISPRTYFIGAP